MLRFGTAKWRVYYGLPVPAPVGFDLFYTNGAWWVYKLTPTP